ncbi:MAG TPA: Fic family protein [Candidatus Baltobacteraceae bacterium]|nr:Fic family protein [Candidatus Baltobacteraceae bacterium]
MAKFEQRTWTPTLGAGLPRRDRQGGRYSVYIPDRLLDRTFLLGGEEAADVADAERAISDLDRTAATLADTEALARLLLRAESVASSHIEGLVIGPRRLLRADAARQKGNDPGDVTAAEVLANIDAMAYAIQAVNEGAAITPALLRETHRRLLEPTMLKEHGGQTRTQQNWIGGSSYNPCSASFVPPPWETVDPLLDDLCSFCNDDSLPTVAQAAIAHAQFETIHPFIDGNGRVGRALIHLVFRRRNLTTTVSPPVSLVLATRVQDYIAGLSATRYVGAPDSKEARDGLNLWLGTFAAACTRAANDAVAFEQRISSIQDNWRERLGAVNRHSVVLRIIDLLPGSPILTIADAQRLTGGSKSSVIEAMRRLEAANVITLITAGRQRGQSYQAKDVVDAFLDLERQLASPAGDTLIETPIRNVPARR